MTNFTPRTTVYKGITMRSRLEAGFAMWLDEQKVKWEYEPCAFGSEAGQYLPDFRCQLFDTGPGKTETFYVEIKPRQPDIPSEAALRAVETRPTPADQLALVHSWGLGQGLTPNLSALGRQMSVVWDSEPDAGLLLVWPGLHVRPRKPGVFRLHRISGGAPEGEAGVFIDTEWTKVGGALALARWMHVPEPWPDGYWNVQ